MVYIKNNLIHPDCGIYLTVISLIEINDIITGSNNITLRKVNVKSYGFEKMYMDEESINKIYTFYNGNGRTCRMKDIDKLKLYIKQYHLIVCIVEKIHKVKLKKL